MTHALDCSQLTKAFAGQPVLRELSLTAAPGEFVTLLGPSGCGKTTTLRLIAGFEQPDRGRISISGRLVAGEGPPTAPEDRRVGMVFQEYALFPHLNVADNIGFGLKLKKNERQSRIAEMLILVGLDSLAQRMPHELSGGQQQRVALARALAPQPDILLLDEPFSNLDGALRAQVRAEVRGILRATGATAVFVTHDQEEALSLSDRIAVIFEGQVAQIDSPRRLYNRPISREVAQFVGEANFLPAQAESGQARCALGLLDLLEVAQGQVQVMIRPEMLSINTNGEGAPAQIAWREFYGHQQRIGLTLHDGTSLIARVGGLEDYQPDERVGVSVSAPVIAFPAS